MATQIVSNAAGIAAVAPDSRVVAVKVLNCVGSGSFADIIAGILYSASLTWVAAPGGDGPDPTPPLPGCAVNPASQGLVLGACSQFSIFIASGPNSYLVAAGTSFASPIAAGVAALIDGQAGGALNGHQIKAALAQSADDLGAPGADPTYSHGRVNAGNAVQ